MEQEILTKLLAKLYEIQEDIGAKHIIVGDAKCDVAQNVVPIGVTGSRKTRTKGSRFWTLKSAILNRLQDIKKMQQETKEENGNGCGDTKAKD